MGMKEEFLLDFDLRLPRILASDTSGIIDNVKNLVLVTDESIIANCGKKYVSVTGEHLVVTFLEEERMFLNGMLSKIEFYGEKSENE